MSRGRFLRAAVVAGFAFLWLPILLLVAYAFSADRIPFQWGGFSLRWFQALAANERLVEAAWLSLRVAAGAATLAVLVGGVAGWALGRFGAFRGRALLGALIGAPLVLPEVVIGPVAAAAFRRFGRADRLARWARGLHHFAGPCRLWRGLCGCGGAGPPCGG